MIHKLVLLRWGISILLCELQHDGFRTVLVYACTRPLLLPCDSIWHFIFAWQYCRDSVYPRSYQMKWAVKEKEHLTHQKESDLLMVRVLKTSVTRYKLQVYPAKAVVLLFFSILDPIFCQFFFSTEDFNSEKAQSSLSMFLECEFNTNHNGKSDQPIPITYTCTFVQNTGVYIIVCIKFLQVSCYQVENK